MDAEKPKISEEVERANTLADGARSALEKTDEFLKWFAEHIRNGTPPPEEKPPDDPLRVKRKSEEAAKPESDLPEWWEDWHALHAENTARQQGKKAEKSEASTLPIGTPVAFEGIYIGQYVLRDLMGDSLGKVFNVYAAPVDLDRKPKTYNKTLKAVGELVDWHGHNGGGYETAKKLLEALNNGSYKGEWVIPPAELLDGNTLNGKLIQPDNLTKHLNAGALNGTLKTGPNWSDWYWSCTELRTNRSSLMYTVRFRPDKRVHSNRSLNKVGCRLVRFVPVQAPGGAHS